MLAIRPDFTFETLEKQFQTVVDCGYHVVSCRDFAVNKAELLKKPLLWVNRVDIDLSPKKALRLAEMMERKGITGTFFVRLHAPEYNPFDFENYRCLKAIAKKGFEIGYHSEIIDQAAIWQESAADCLRKDLKILSEMLEVKIDGVASHGGMTGLNNLDFWKEHRPEDFGLLYEAYDKESGFGLFDQSLYVSDSNWTFWKSYTNGKLNEGDGRNMAEHAKMSPPVVYSLIHPETYFDRHFYE